MVVNLVIMVFFVFFLEHLIFTHIWLNVFLLGGTMCESWLQTWVQARATQNKSGNQCMTARRQ